MKHIMSYDSFIIEGIQKSGDLFTFDWNTDQPEDLMSLHFKKYQGRKQKLGATEYSYYYAYQLDKSEHSTNLLKSIKMMDDNVSSRDIQQLISKAILGFDSIFGSNTFNAIIVPQSSSLILTELSDQLAKKSGVSILFPESFVKAASTDIKLDHVKVDNLPEKTKKEVYRSFTKATNPNLPFKIKDIFSRYRKFFTDFIIFNSQDDRKLFNAVQGQRVILIDDYRTSGTTIKEMIKQLADVGAVEVIVFVLIKLGD